MTPSDKTLVCAECGASFTFTSGEQEFFASRGYTNEPKRCPECREARKSQQRGGGDLGRLNARCIQQSAPSAALRPWFPLDPVATGQYTVAIASTR